jgi:hypothetical protein
MSTTHYNFNSTTPETENLIDALMSKMTLGEKVGQMVQVHIHDGNVKEIEERLRKGQVGSILTLYGVENINHAQKIAVEESRLGIPIILGNDVIHGYRTIFPIPLAEACTWDPDLVEEATKIAAEEASANGVDWTFAPMVDICRDPRGQKLEKITTPPTYLKELFEILFYLLLKLHLRKVLEPQCQLLTTSMGFPPAVIHLLYAKSYARNGSLMVL